MLYVGIDLHKKTIALCVVNQERKIVDRKTLHCGQPEMIRAYFARLGPFQAVVEATASYEWLWELLEPMAQQLVLAHPKKLRIIAESTRKSDRLDAQVLAEFLALDLIPRAYRPTPRQRQHRALVRQRLYLRQRITSVKNKVRALVSHYNADRADLFHDEGLAFLEALTLTPADRLVVQQLLALWEFLEKQLQALDKELALFAKKGPSKEAEARALLRTIPGVGAVTVDIVLSEVGDVTRFHSAKAVAAYAGLVPGQRESSDHKKELGITKDGSRLLRWALVEAAWRLVRQGRRWQVLYERLRQRRGKKKAIVAVARHLLTVMVAVWRSGQPYRHAYAPALA